MLGHEELQRVVVILPLEGLTLIRPSVEPLVACDRLPQKAVNPLTELQLVYDVLPVSVFCVS